MSEHTLRKSLADYLCVRRALGFKLSRDALLLEQFVGFCERAGVPHVTSELAIAWATLPENPSPAWLAMRISIVRSFARWLQAIDPKTEVPQRSWLPRTRKTIPYLYSEKDVAMLMAAARRARWPLTAATYETLIGLLSVTGMRVGEAIRLDMGDVLLAERLLSIRDAKLGKSRQLVIHPSTVVVLEGYLCRRSMLSPLPNESGFFVSSTGHRISYPSVQFMFRSLIERAGIEAPSEHSRPTLHGFRHTFAVNTLVRWYREEEDVQARLPHLSTWLGHVDPKSTYWYLSSSPELLGLAGDRLEKSQRRRP